MLKIKFAHALAPLILGGLLTACGGSSGGDSNLAPGGGNPGSITLGTAPISEKTRCELATYPSLEWTQCEAENLLVSQGAEATYAPFFPQVVTTTLAYQAARLQAVLADPERQPNPNTCTTVVLCPIDPRLQNWPDADGIVEPVLYTSRAGATISGHVWATRSGPAKRPGVVFISGSIFGYEQLYWYVAQALAKAGFVVMTFDVQGEGMSDQFGEAPDEREQAFAGTPGTGLLGPTPTVDMLGGNGLAFYDGGADALEFFLSTPAQPYVPVPSRSSGTSHDAKQQRRVAAGLNSAFNPFWQMLDTSALGLVGHSYGAIASSWLGQQDPRVDAVVAMDNLCVPVFPSPDEITAFTTAPVNQPAGGLLLYGFSPDCFGAPPGVPAPALTKPALGLTVDYLLTPFPYAAPPRPLDKVEASLAYSAAGVDNAHITVRGGTHIDHMDLGVGFIPFSLRGRDVIAWYTTAWFAKYLQRNPDADRMLLSARWRDDAAAGAVDPAGDANLYSWHYGSRLDVTLESGDRYNCENLRNGCAGQYRATEDCGPPDYSFVVIDNAPGAAPPVVCETSAQP